jgi:ATP-dependent exoDNAse (exonuclease V) beta subunit
MSKLSNIEVVAAAKYLDDLDAGFPIRSATRVSRSRKALQEEADFIRERQQEVNEKYQKENEDGEPLFKVFVPGEDSPRELTQEEAQELAEENDNISAQNLQMGQKWENPKKRQEELEDLMQDDSGIDPESDLHMILEDELDAVQDAFEGERVSEVIERIENVLDLSATQKEELESAINPVLQNGVSLSDLATIEFLMPVS